MPFCFDEPNVAVLSFRQFQQKNTCEQAYVTLQKCYKPLQHHYNVVKCTQRTSHIKVSLSQAFRFGKKHFMRDLAIKFTIGC